MEMAKQCAKEMGFEKNQFIAVSHMDTGHQHLHIVANRVGYDGKVVSDSQNYKKIAAFCRQTELKYNLKQVLSPRKYLKPDQRNIPRLDTRKEKLKTNIKECLSDSKSFIEFEIKIKERGYEIIKGRGISFIDKQAVKVKGSEVDYSIQKIEKILALQHQLQKVREDKLLQEQSRKLQQLQKQPVGFGGCQEVYDLKQHENLLSKTIEQLL